MPTVVLNRHLIVLEPEKHDYKENRDSTSIAKPVCLLVKVVFRRCMVEIISESNPAARIGRKSRRIATQSL